MTTHEMAAQLLNHPDVPVVAYNALRDEWREVRGVSKIVVRPRFLDKDDKVVIAEAVPISILNQ